MTWLLRSWIEGVSETEDLSQVAWDRRVGSWPVILWLGWGSDMPKTLRQLLRSHTWAHTIKRKYISTAQIARQVFVDLRWRLDLFGPVSQKAWKGVENSIQIPKPRLVCNNRWFGDGFLVFANGCKSCDWSYQLTSKLPSGLHSTCYFCGFARSGCWWWLHVASPVTFSRRHTLRWALDTWEPVERVLLVIYSES